MSLLSSGKTYTRTNVYAYDSATKLTDGVQPTGSPILDNSKEIWWYQNSWDVVVDLGKLASLSSVRFHFEVWLPAAVPAPISVTIYGSTDGSSWSAALVTGARGTDWVATNGVAWSNALSVSGDYRYVKFSFGNPGSGNVCALSEVEVNGEWLLEPTVNYLRGRPRNRWDYGEISREVE